MTKQLVIVLALALGSVACNNERLTSAPDESPTPTVAPTNTPAVPGEPVAIITGQTSSQPLATADFSGTASYSPNGAITGYAWEITARPAGSASQLTTPTGSTVTFFVDLAGSYTVKLTVTDVANKTGSTTLTFDCVPSQGLHAELTWVNQYTQADMDLHLVNNTASGTFWDANTDCHWENCKTAANNFGIAETLDWFVQGYAPDNPTLDIDNINVSVPENINVITPAKSSSYEVWVHYFPSLPPIPLVNASVNLYFAGVQAYTCTQMFTEEGQLWDVGTVSVSAAGQYSFAAKLCSNSSTTNLTTTPYCGEGQASCTAGP